VPYGDQLGLDWLIVIVIPEVDFITQMDSNIRMTFWLCFAAVATPWIMGGMMTNWKPKRLTSNPIQSYLSQPDLSQLAVNQSNQYLSVMDAEANLGCHSLFDQQSLPDQRNLSEPPTEQLDQQNLLDHQNLHYQNLQTVGVTAQTFNQIAEKLSLSFQQIEAENTSLEAQVRERTAQLCQALEFEDLLRRTSEKVRDSLDEAHILQTVVRELTLGLGVQGCDVSLYNLEDGTSTLCYEHLGTHLSPAQGRSIALDTLSAYDLLLQGQHTQFCLLKPLPTALRSEQAHFACLSCPIMDDQGVLGDLWLFKPKQQNFSLQEVRLVQQIANQCAIALRQSHLYQTAQAQVKELEQLHRIKDDFLNTVSHELRTPIANIEMGAQLLEMSLKQSGFLETTTAPVYRYLQILKDEAHHEMILINNLLDLSRLDAGIEPYIATTIDPQTWIPHVVEPFTERTEMQQQQLQLDLPPDLPPLTTDLVDLERILSELLNNACKYTPAGEKIVVRAFVFSTHDKDKLQMPVVSTNRHQLSSIPLPEPIFTRDLLGQPVPASCPRSPAPSDLSTDPRLFHFLLKVTNSGIEISKAEQDRIFEKFYRIRSNDPWKHGGTGLGLALVKGLVERLSGKIWVESGSGTTTFTVQLPLEGRR
jgi:signal transduction histidine kinase